MISFDVLSDSIANEMFNIISFRLWLLHQIVHNFFTVLRPKVTHVHEHDFIRGRFLGFGKRSIIKGWLVSILIVRCTHVNYYFDNRKSVCQTNLDLPQLCNSRFLRNLDVFLYAIFQNCQFVGILYKCLSVNFR